MDNLIIHVGNPRCGSVALLKYMNRHRDIFAQNNIRCSPSPDLFGVSGSHKDIVENIRDRFKYFNFPNVFTSRSSISGYNFLKEAPNIYKPDYVELFKELMSEYNIYVWLVIRRQDRLIESSYLHARDKGLDMDLPEYVENSGDLSFSRQVNFWSQLDGIHVTPFDQYKEHNDKALEKMFKETVGVDMDLPDDIGIVNERLGNATLLEPSRRDQIIKEYREDNLEVFDKISYNYSWNVGIV